ncbi:MAG: glycosyltransferase family 4 protein [Patescibacteria group bacterium]
MKICFFGIYDPTYPRNRILKRAFELSGHTVVECRTNKKGVGKYRDLIRKHAQIRGRYDIMFVAFPGQQALILARLISSKKIIFDPFFSLHMTLVDDRQKYSRVGLHAAYYYLLDLLSCHLAHAYLFDTFAHRDFFVNKFGCDPERSHRILVGSDPSVFYPDANDSSSPHPFTVHFHGTNIPLHGVPTVLAAGKMLSAQGIQISVVGTSIKRMYEKEYPEVSFHDDVLYEDLREYINRADVSIGIAGTTHKIHLVIPNKVYEAWACRKPVVTARTEAIEEIAQDGQNVLLCIPGDSNDLARAVLSLRDDSGLAKRIGGGGYELFMSRGTPEKIAEDLKRVIERVIS